MKYLLMILLVALFFPGCTATIAWRGVVYNYQQEATTGGHVSNQPWSEDASVAAEKTTDLKADIPLVK